MKQDSFLWDNDQSVVEDQRVGYNGTDVVRIALQVTNISYNVGVFTQVQQEPGKSSSLSYENKLAYGDNLGSDNPSITIQGIIDLNSYDETGNAALAADDFGGLTWAWTPTMKLLQQIYSSGHIFKLYDKFNQSSIPGNDVWRMHSLTGVVGLQVIGEINMMCTGLTINTNTQVNEGAKLTFSLKFREVRI